MKTTKQKLTHKEKQEATQKVNNHLRILKEKLFKIEVQVLQEGDKFTTQTGSGPEEHTVTASGYLPVKKNRSDAGFDVFTPVDVTVNPGQIVKVPLNIRMKLPSGSWARIETKSGHGAKGHLVYAGVIDQDYRGIPHVIMTNLNSPVEFDEQTGEMKKSDKVLRFPAGTKIAQITMNPHSLDFYMEKVESVDTNTDRGEGGFGSTGLVNEQ